MNHPKILYVLNPGFREEYSVPVPTCEMHDDELSDFKENILMAYRTALRRSDLTAKYDLERLGNGPLVA